MSLSKAMPGMQANLQLAGVRFLKHNVRDDFDDLTDVARLYGVRAVPCFVFFVGGAQVDPSCPAPVLQQPNVIGSTHVAGFFLHAQCLL